MGEARRKRLMARKSERLVSQMDAKLADRKDDIVRMRREYDELSAGWSPALEDFATRVGPRIFPKDDPTVAKHLIWRSRHLKDAASPKKFGEDDVALLATVLDPFVKKSKSILHEGVEELRSRVGEDQIRHDDGNYRDVALILAGIYARRMLEDCNDPGVYVPFREIDWAKHMTPDDTRGISKHALEMFLQDEASLKGSAAAARDAFNALSDKEQGYYDELARNVPRHVHDAIGFMLNKRDQKKLNSLQVIFECCWNTLSDPKEFRVENTVLFSFALAKMIVRENTMTEEKLLAKLDEEFERRLRTAEGSLKGAAREARIVFSSLDQKDQDDLTRYVDAKLEQRLLKLLEDNLSDGKDTSLQSMFEAALPVARDEVLRGLRSTVSFDGGSDEDLAPVLAYIMVKKMAHMISSVAHDARDQSVRGHLVKKMAALDDAPDESIVINFTNRLWSDEQLTTVGMKLWELTYKVGKGDTDVAQAARAVAQQWAKDRGEEAGSRRLVVVEDIISFSAKWAVHAFQRITTTHTYAAALMCSDADKQVIAEIEMQYSAFMVCLPNGILSYTDDDGTTREYNRILVARFDKRAVMIMLNQAGSWSGPNLFLSIAPTLADVLQPHQDSIEEGDVAISREGAAKFDRVVILAKRLVAGLMLAMQTKTNFTSKMRSGKSGKSKREAEEPEHRVVFVGAPLKIDCRPSITDYIEHGSSKRKGAPPQVQTLVRGHFRRQVCGVGRRDRKTIWIEPFWRGPEDAPILTRPKAVAASEKRSP